MIDDMGKGGNSKDEISEAKASGWVSFFVQQSRLVTHSHRKQKGRRKKPQKLLE